MGKQEKVLYLAKYGSWSVLKGVFGICIWENKKKCRFWTIPQKGEFNSRTYNLRNPRKITQKSEIWVQGFELRTGFGEPSCGEPPGVQTFPGGLEDKLAESH